MKQNSVSYTLIVAFAVVVASAVGLVWFVPMQAMAQEQSRESERENESRNESSNGSDVDKIRHRETEKSLVPLHKVVADISAQAPYKDMTYLGGVRYYSRAKHKYYGLKFLDGNQVIVVYVNAYNGKIVGHRR